MTDEESDDELSGRAQKWAQSSDESEQSEPTDTSETSEMSEASERSERMQSGESTSSEHVEQSEQSEQSESSERVQNVKKEWNDRYVYLPDGLHDRVNSEFRRLKYECGELDESLDVKKNRHYYPLVVARGLDAIEEMDGDAFVAALEKEGLR